MKIDEQRRRIIANAMLEQSYLNIVANSQFNAPSYPGTHGLIGADYSKDRSKLILLSNGVSGTTPTNQKRLYCYTNSNPIGIAESASDLTYLGLSNDLVFEISGVRQQIGIGIHWDSDLGKIWLRHTTNAAMISEYTFDFTTLTATYVQSKVLSGDFSSGNFYFNPTYTKLFVSSGTTTFQEYTLSTAGDISTATLTSAVTGVQFTNFPIFFEMGTSAIFSFYNIGSGQSDLRKTQLSTPYDINTFIVAGYVQPFYRSAVSGYRVTATLPIIASIGLKKINYFSGAISSGGRIGVGTFDDPLDFEGLGSGNGGVKVGGTLVT